MSFAVSLVSHAKSGVTNDRRNRLSDMSFQPFLVVIF